MAPPRLAGEREPVHAARHDQVGEEQVDLRMVAQDLQGLAAVARHEGDVAVIAQDRPGELGHIGPVVHDQDRLAARPLLDGRGRRALLAGRSVGRREAQAHGGALPRHRFDLDRAARLLGEAVDHGQAEPGALALFLGGEERVHHPRQHLGGHAGARIGDAEADGAARPLAPLVARGDGDAPALRHRVAGVDEHVEQGDLGLGPVDPAGPEIGGEIGLDRHGLAERAPGQFLHLRDEVVEVEGAVVEALLAGEGEELLRQRRGALSRLADIAHRPAHPALVGVRSLQVGRQGIGVAEDHLEQVVEVVGDAAGELTERLHLLRLVQRFLRGPAAADVELRAEKVQKVAGGVEDRADEQRVPEA